MTAAGCGCSAIETAAAHQDPGAAETIAASASDSQHGWRCPNAGHPEPCHDDPPLGEDQQAALVAVKNLTGASGFKTCPLWYTRQPWIGEVIAAWRAEKNGQLRERVGWPSLALYQAIRSSTPHSLPGRPRRCGACTRRPKTTNRPGSRANQ